MLTASSQKKIIRSKQSHDLTNTPESRMLHVRSQQNLLQKTVVDDVKIEQNILKDIEQTRQIISKYNSEIETKTPSVTPPQSINQCVLSLYDLQKIIQSKNAQISLISQQIKGLKSSPNQIYKDFNLKFKTIKNMQLIRLSDEISQQKDELFKLHKQHQRKKKQLMQNRKIMKQTVEAHTNMLTTGSKRIMSYQEFISKRKDKDREREDPEDPNHKSKRLSKRNIINIKQAAESDEDKKNLVFINSNNLTEVQNKRRVAQQALRVAKKKHQDQINDFNSKLQFLRDENDQLDAILEKKALELKEAELKFSQKQQISQPKKILRVVRYSEPEL